MSNEELPGLPQEGMWSCTALLACVNGALATKAAVPLKEGALSIALRACSLMNRFDSVETQTQALRSLQ